MLHFSCFFGIADGSSVINDSPSSTDDDDDRSCGGAEAIVLGVHP